MAYRLLIYILLISKTKSPIDKLKKRILNPNIEKMEKSLKKFKIGIDSYENINDSINEEWQYILDDMGKNLNNLYQLYKPERKNLETYHNLKKEEIIKLYYKKINDLENEYKKYNNDYAFSNDYMRIYSRTRSELTDKYKSDRENLMKEYVEKYQKNQEKLIKIIKDYSLSFFKNEEKYLMKYNITNLQPNKIEYIESEIHDEILTIYEIEIYQDIHTAVKEIYDIIIKSLPNYGKDKGEYNGTFSRLAYEAIDIIRSEFDSSLIVSKNIEDHNCLTLRYSIHLVDKCIVLRSSFKNLSLEDKKKIFNEFQRLSKFK